MKNNALTRRCWLAALGVTIPCLLYSAEVTNQPPAAGSTERTNQVESTRQAQPPPPAIAIRAKVVYKPPLLGTPAVRIDGGSRGSGVSLVCLTVLTPDQTAFTVQEQPSLFWYQSDSADVPFELTLLTRNTVQPLLRLQLPSARGIQRLNLADHNVKLVPGVEYEWVVALVVDPKNRSKDVVAGGWIERVEPSTSLRSRLENASAEDLPSVYAEEGIWLDTLTAISALIDAHPKDRPLQEARAGLLDQVGLTNAATYLTSQITRE